VLDVFSWSPSRVWSICGLNCVVVPLAEVVAPVVEEPPLPADDVEVDAAEPVLDGKTARTKNSGSEPALVPVVDDCGSRDCRSAYRLLLLDGVTNSGDVDIALSSKDDTDCRPG
jgi:hypothetical protein